MATLDRLQAALDGGTSLAFLTGNNGATPAGITVLASSVVQNDIISGSRHEATIYVRGSAVVFAAGTINFDQLLRTQPAVAQIAKNVLSRAGATGYVQ